MAGLNDSPLMRTLAVPGVCLLIAFLGYFSQLLFRYSTLDPGPLTVRQTYIGNAMLLCIWWTYYKTVTTDPGRYDPFQGGATVVELPFADNDKTAWCRKCEAPKPKRAHHCKTCRRCVPKMDHHCPWTSNCVSMTTFPHFLRFLAFTNGSLWYMGRCILWPRAAILWEHRHLPAYLGPTLPALAGLALLSLVWFVATAALGILLITTAKGWVLNMTMIESWELERHEALLQRSAKDWWDVTGPDGDTLRVEATEFPYDIGFFANMAQAMGTSNVLAWFFPLAGNPTIGGKVKNSEPFRGPGWEWPENGLNRIEGMWPPPDPDKIRRGANGAGWPAARRDYAAELDALDGGEETPQERKLAFERRQRRDAKRKSRMMNMGEVPDSEEESDDSYDDDDDDYNDYDNDDTRRKGTGWMNSEGERLGDFGVDEEAEYTDEVPVDVEDDEDVPLGELLRRRKATRAREDE